MYKYTYVGPVVRFGVILANKWRGETWAPSEKKARSNLAYQFKTSHGYVAESGDIKFPGKIRRID